MDPNVVHKENDSFEKLFEQLHPNSSLHQVQWKCHQCEHLNNIYNFSCQNELCGQHFEGFRPEDINDYNLPHSDSWDVSEKNTLDYQPTDLIPYPFVCYNLPDLANFLLSHSDLLGNIPVLFNPSGMDEKYNHEHQDSIQITAPSHSKVAIVTIDENEKNHDTGGLDGADSRINDAKKDKQKNQSKKRTKRRSDLDLSNILDGTKRKRRRSKRGIDNTSSSSSSSSHTSIDVDNKKPSYFLYTSDRTFESLVSWQDVWPFPTDQPRLEGTTYSYNHTAEGDLGFTVETFIHSDYIARIRILHIVPNIDRGDLNENNLSIQLGKLIYFYTLFI